jgi:hypothetical protein
MRLQYLVTIASVVTGIQARCYGTTTGMYGQSMTGAAAAVDEYCTDSLAGYFTENQIKYGCLQLSQSKVEFWVGWSGHGSWTLSSDDCKQRLKSEINGCRLGGDNVVADWFFR